MHIKIDRSGLAKGLAHTQNVVERRNTIPILNNVLLEASNGVLLLTATDMDLTVQETLDCDVAQDGSLTVPAHMFYDIVRKLPDGQDVEIKSTGDVGRVTISAGKAEFTLGTLPREDFPNVQGDSLPQHFFLGAEALRSMIDRTRFAISTEETRYYLNGIFMHTVGEGATATLRGVATDGHRLARVELNQPQGAQGMPGVIIPRKTVGELRKLIDETDSDIKIELSESSVQFSFDRVRLRSRLIDGTYPDYEGVIPANNKHILRLDKSLFAASVDRVSTISADKIRAVKMAVQPGGVSVSSTSQDTGSATEELEADYQGPDVQVGFNARYLMDIASQLEGDVAEFALEGPSTPTLIRDPDDQSALFVIMPMRV